MWVKWLHLGEYCYNSTYHMSIRMTPFRALYGYDAPSFMETIFGKSRFQGLDRQPENSQNSEGKSTGNTEPTEDIHK